MIWRMGNRRRRQQVSPDIEDVIEPQFRKNSICFADKCPELAEQWCYKKNCGWGPEDFAQASSVKAWWTCPKCNRDYKQRIGARSASGHGCSYCSSRLVCDDNSLAKIFPDIAKQWHPTKNGRKRPDQYTFAAQQEVWWQCPRGDDHVWKGKIAARTNREATSSETLGCPFCHGLRPSVTNSLGDLFPELLGEWHQEKNGELTPHQIAAHSAQRVWWQCAEGHAWKQTPDRRAIGVGCPFCTGKKVAVERSLASVSPASAKRWHPTKNGKIKPKHVIATSKLPYWWQCLHGHEWQASPAKSTAKSFACPHCNLPKVPKNESLATLYPLIAKQWDAELNELTPHDVVPGSHKKYFWKCPGGVDHVWEQSVKERVRFLTCPFCSGRRVSKANNLAALHPEIAAEWYQEKNGELTPNQVRPGSRKLVWWKCGVNGEHQWQSKVAQRVYDKQVCPTCNRKKTFAELHPELATQWHAKLNGGLRPADVCQSYHQPVWWQCAQNKRHQWQATVETRVYDKQECPQCRPSKKQDLEATHPELLLEWHKTKNGKLRLNDVGAGSPQRVWWQCQYNRKHSWQASAAQRIYDKQQCPLCRAQKTKGR